MGGGRAGPRVEVVSFLMWAYRTTRSGKGRGHRRRGEGKLARVVFTLLAFLVWDTRVRYRPGIDRHAQAFKLKAQEAMEGAKKMQAEAEVPFAARTRLFVSFPCPCACFVCPSRALLQTVDGSRTGRGASHVGGF